MSEKAELIERLKIAIYNDDPAEIRAAVHEGRMDLNSKEYFAASYPSLSSTPLSQAAGSEKFKAVECLFELGADYRCEYISIMRQACSSSPKMVQCLIDCGADVNYRDKNGTALLHSLAEAPGIIKGDEEWDTLCQSMEVIRRAGAWVNIRNNEGETPLHLAASMNMEDMVELLIYRFGAACDIPDKTGWYTPWDVAIGESPISTWNSGIIELMIKSGPLIHLNGRLPNGWSYLHGVVDSFTMGTGMLRPDRVVELVRYMLDQGAYVDPIAGSRNLTPLAVVAYNSRLMPEISMAIIRLLIERGANPRVKIGPNRDQPLPAALQKKGDDERYVHSDVREFFQQYL